VHVWRLALDLPPAALDACRAVLSPDEHARAARLFSDQHRRRFVAARGLLRTILGRHLDEAPQAVRFAYGAHGKPALAGDVALRFNLAHSHELALVAVAEEREVGVDLERLRPEVAVLDIARRFFSSAEHRALHAAPPAERQLTFFRLWTCKEACVKATGEGVARALRATDVVLGPDTAQLRPPAEPGGPARWALHELRPDAGYAGALAVEGAGWRLSCWRWPTA
jgi:4'-phosphopantetheinyl transferase